MTPLQPPGTSLMTATRLSPCPPLAPWMMRMQVHHMHLVASVLRGRSRAAPHQNHRPAQRRTAASHCQQQRSVATAPANQYQPDIYSLHDMPRQTSQQLSMAALSLAFTACVVFRPSENDSSTSTQQRGALSQASSACLQQSRAEQSLSHKQVIWNTDKY